MTDAGCTTRARGARRMFPAAVCLLLAGPAEAAPVKFVLGGNVKSFFLVSAPRPWFGLSDEAQALFAAAGTTEAEALDAFGLGTDPVAQGVGSGRLNASVQGEGIRLDVQWAVALQTAAAATDLPGFGTGVGLSAPELVPLSGAPDTGDQFQLRHRVDRLVVAARLPHTDLTLGRQPVSFGSGRFFTPLDLVNPFHPATIDTEYKPGVDAVRVDTYPGTASRVSAVAAWAGKPVVGTNRRDADTPVLDDLVLAANGQGTVGVTDVLGFVGAVHGEPVFGLGVESSLGPVGIHGDGTLTLPGEGADPFVRVVVGADGRPTSTTTLTGEAYLQSFGATDPADYLAAVDTTRFQRGEIWQMGQLYAALAVVQEITPLLHANASLITNLRDPSALVAVGGSWSISDNADLAIGGYYGLGRGPDRLEFDVGVDPVTGAPTLVAPADAAITNSVNSEFGLYPALAYVQMRAYF